MGQLAKKADTKLAIHGGTPVRTKSLPYARQAIDKADTEAVAKVLNSDWLTTGPKIPEFEMLFSRYVGAQEGVAVNSGTAALHCALKGAGVGQGDEVIVPSMTFAASSNAALYLGAKPVFADISEDTLLIDPESVARLITQRTKAVVCVDYAGQPCDYEALRKICSSQNIKLVSDGCHALGATLHGKKVGSIADLTAFSFHPAKHITTGEGGMVTTNDAKAAALMRTFRNHGITTDTRQREKQVTHAYEMVELGFNYRLSDIGCALGISQLAKLDGWVEARRSIADTYDESFTRMDGLTPLTTRPGTESAHHLYVVKLQLEKLDADRNEIFKALRAEGIGVNVHYLPVHLHPYYQRVLGTKPGMCPRSEKVYEQILSIPMFATMTDTDVENVVDAFGKVLNAYLK